MVKGLLERFRDGEQVLAAEGYLFEFERRGYLKAGSYVPEVVLKHPDLVKSLHREFVHAGSDVVLAFTYYAHRQKLRLIGREEELESWNRTALRVAREIAEKTDTLMAGNICNTTLYESGNGQAIEESRKIFKEQIEWAVQEGAHFVVAETFGDYGEASLALKCIKDYGSGLPAVVMMAPTTRDDTTHDGLTLVEAMQKLEAEGADAVGLNCGRGPATMLPLLKQIRDACKGPVCALPVPYRTTVDAPNMQRLKNADGSRSFPYDLPAHLCGRSEIEQFGKATKEMGINYVGLCCGNAGHYMRSLAESVGRQTPASKYSPDLKQHFAMGTDDKLVKRYTSNIYKLMYE